MDTELFFPVQEKGSGELEERVKKVCASCEIRIDCLEWSLENDDRWGIFGGMNRTERLRYRDGK